MECAGRGGTSGRYRRVFLLEQAAMYDPLLLRELREILIENDARAMQEFCEVFHSGVVAENLEALSNEDIWRVLSHTGLRRQVEIFEFLSLPRQMELVTTVDKA